MPRFRPLASTTLLVAVSLLPPAPAVAADDDAPTPGAFVLMEDNLTVAPDRSTATLAVDGVTLTLDAGDNTFKLTNKGRTVGVGGHKSSLINQDEIVTLTFDQDVELGGLEFASFGKKKGEAVDEELKVLVPDLAIEIEVSTTHGVTGHDGCTLEDNRQLIFATPLTVPAGTEILVAATPAGGDFGLSLVIAVKGSAPPDDLEPS